MIVKLRGLLSDGTEESVILEREGMAYEVLVPAYAAAELIACRGETITLHTLQYLEGNAATGGNMIPRMIGFMHPEDRAFFRQFTTVKGVGMRKGLRALAAPVGQIAAEIESGNTAALSRLPGIGRRLAEQMVAELRGKVSKHALAAAASSAPGVKQRWSDEQRAAIEILVAWGDSRVDSERWLARAVQSQPELASAEDWIKAAYRMKSGTD